MRGFGSKNKSKTRVIRRNLMIFDVIFGDIFRSLNEIILKICEDLPIGLSNKNLVDIGVDIVMKMRQKTLL